jgi:predicted acylesterase/phospholipase RssA
MDGGVLNNAPFAPVLDEITARRGGPAERIVMFVVPSGGVLADEAVKKERCENVRIHTTAWNALNYPSEADFRSGIDEVQFRLEISGPRSRDELLARLLDRDRGREEERDMRVAAKALYAEYRRGRVLAVQKRLTFTNARVTALKTAAEPLERTLRQVLEQEDLRWLAPSALRNLTEPGLENWRWGLTPTERLLQNLLYQLHQLLNEAREDENQAWVRALSEAIPLVNDSLLKVLAIHEAVTEKTQWDECPPGPWEEAWKLDEVFKDLSVPSSVGDLVHKAARCFLRTVHFCGRFEHWRRPEDVVAAMLLVEVLTQTFAPPARAIEKLSPEFRFLRLRPDHMGPLFNEDWSVDLGDRKLYGLRCYHFAAFMKEEWRRHDFTWGRLDAAHHLLGLLSGQGCDEKTERELQKAILIAEDGLARESGEDDPTERMRVRLKKLDESTDDEMLDQGLPREKQVNLLRPLGLWRFLRRPLLRYVKWRRMTRSQKAFWRVVSVVLLISLGVMLWFVLHR